MSNTWDENVERVKSLVETRFIDYDRALERVRRNYNAEFTSVVTANRARRNAIVQTWAEVTNQTWKDALKELEDA